MNDSVDIKQVRGVYLTPDIHLKIRPLFQVRCLLGVFKREDLFLVALCLLQFCNMKSCDNKAFLEVCEVNCLFEARHLFGVR